MNGFLFTGWWGGGSRDPFAAPCTARAVARVRDPDRACHP